MEYYTNLYDETIDVLFYNGYTVADIDWVGGYKHYFDTDQYLAIAKETNYDSGNGFQFIAIDLTIKMKDGAWFSRQEYDGMESFKYHHAPQRPLRKLETLKTLGGDDSVYETIEEMNCVEPGPIVTNENGEIEIPF